MQKLDVSKIVPMLSDAAKESNLDQALAPLFNAVDPNNEHDLGGHAGVWFSGGKAKIWATYPAIHRLSQLAQFFDHIDDRDE